VNRIFVQRAMATRKRRQTPRPVTSGEAVEPEVILSDDTLDLRGELVPAIRALLARGLSNSFMRACVRIGGFETYVGGLKADLVGGLTIHVNAALKLGGPELEAHAVLMNAINARRPGTFAEVLEVVSLEGGRRLVLMAQLRKHETLFELVYAHGTTRAALGRALDKTFAGLAAVHAVGPGAIRELAHLPVTPDPYTPRIRPKLMAALQADSALAPMLRQPGRVLGLACPPVGELLVRLEERLGGATLGAPRVLVHGDPHLRNVLVRSYGQGLAARFIDPNPDYGYTDPAYDFGKLLHFAEPVGWALARPEICWAHWRAGRRGWMLKADAGSTVVAAERRRDFLEHEIHARIARTGWCSDPTWVARLHVARASAHLGLLARFVRPDAAAARRFVLAHALAALAAWHATVP